MGAVRMTVPIRLRHVLCYNLFTCIKTTIQRL